MKVVRLADDPQLSDDATRRRALATHSRPKQHFESRRSKPPPGVDLFHLGAEQEFSSVDVAQMVLSDDGHKPGGCRTHRRSIPWVGVMSGLDLAVGWLPFGDGSDCNGNERAEFIADLRERDLEKRVLSVDSKSWDAHWERQNDRYLRLG